MTYIKNKYKNLIYICLNVSLLFFYNQIIGMNKLADEVISLAVGLNNLSNKVIEPGINFLLGPTLIGKDFNEILNKQIREKYNIQNNLALMAFDDKNKIYQLRVLQQKFMDCEYNAIKNSLILSSNFFYSQEEFYKRYALLLDKVLYGKFTAALSDELKIDVTKECGSDISRINNLVNSKDFLSKIFNNVNDIDLALKAAPRLIYGLNLDFNNTIKFIVLDTSSIEKDVLIKKYKENLTEYEKLKPDFAQEQAVLAFLLSNLLIFPFENFKNLYDQFASLSNDKNYFFGLQLSTFTTMQHAIGVVIHKYLNNTELLILDSLNQKYSDNRSYKDSIDNLQKIISSNISDLFVRSLCLLYLITIQDINNSDQENSEKQESIKFYTSQLLDRISKLGLSENQTFLRYKSLIDKSAI